MPTKPNVTLRQFRYFVCVAESDSVAAASRMLNVAQSAVTKSILDLEDSLSAQLFVRSSRGMSLTPEGHRFLVAARNVISSVADATNFDRAQPQGIMGTLSIGVTSLVAGYYLSDLLARFKRNCPAVRVLVTEDTPNFLEHLLIGGELDVAIMVCNALEEPQALQVETLTRSPNRVWMAANHRLSQEEDVALADCAKDELIVLEADRVGALMSAVWRRHHLNPNIVMRTSSLEAVRSLVGSGIGIAVLPDFLYRPWTLDAEHVAVRALREGAPTVDVGLVWRRGSRMREVVSEFIEVAREQSRSRARRNGG